jgi:hypothetical protein
MSLAFDGEGRVIARGGELLKVSLELTDGYRRVQDVGGNGPDVSGGVAVRLVPQTAGFEAIEDLFGKAPAGAGFARH